MPEPRPDHALPPTEQRTDAGPVIDTLDAGGIVARMSALDRGIAEAVAAQAEPIARVVARAAEALRRDGRIIYAGAGTSGRLAVLDAAECPPTFGVDRERVVALIAGGEAALRHSVEGAEDDRELGAEDLRALAPAPADLVVGVAASGTTPYVHGVLAEAKRAGAGTALLCCNPAPAEAADVVMAVITGPEALAGSTRLKAGTATKLVLNMISTGAMTLAGYVFEGYMVGMRPVNAKLKQRGARIVAALCEVSEAEGARLLAAAEDDIRVAVLMGRRGLDAETARRRLEAAKGRLRDALEAS